MNDDRQISRGDFIGLVVAFVGGILCVIGTIWTYTTQVQAGATTLWPLPGLVLVDWALLGIIGFFAAFIIFRENLVIWQQVIWAISGAFIPLIILGAGSIGPFVLIEFGLFMVCSLFLSVQRQPKWLENFGALMLGAIINLGLLTAIIFLGGSRI